MKLPCEIVAIDILPIIRKELSVILIETYEMDRTKVSKLFGVSGTAISQYMNGIRGDASAIMDLPQYGSFMDEITVCAKRIAEDKSKLVDELCHMCEFAEESGMVECLYKKDGMDALPAKCLERPK
jgi:predicted transcriptional regulator